LHKGASNNIDRSGLKTIKSQAAEVLKNCGILSVYEDLTIEGKQTNVKFLEVPIKKTPVST